MNSPSVQVLSPLLACVCDTVRNVGLSYPDLFTCDNYTGLPYPDLFACDITTLVYLILTCLHV